MRGVRASCRFLGDVRVGGRFGSDVGYGYFRVDALRDDESVACYIV